MQELGETHHPIPRQPERSPVIPTDVEGPPRHLVIPTEVESLP